MNKTVCSYPFFAAAIRPNGLTIPCCRYPHIDEEDSYVWNDRVRNTEHWKDIRDKMLSGEPVEGCHGCYQDERNGLRSMRQHSLSKFTPTENKTVPVQQLEVSFSNLCNLACAHCSGFFSSKWQAEDKKANRVETKGFLKNDFDFEKWDLSSVTDLKIIGGEPFMEGAKFKKLLRSLDLTKVNLQICTNGTILPDQELKDLIEQCNNVYLCVSMDGIYTANDWYRWPSKFDDCISIIKTFEEWWQHKSNVHFIIHTVVNLVNVLELDKLVDYIHNNLPLWKVEWDWIRWPHWQQLSSLPNSTKNNLIEKFNRLNLDYNYAIIDNPYKVTIERLSEDRIDSWQLVKENISSLDKERNLNFLEMVPSFKEIWNLND